MELCVGCGCGCPGAAVGAGTGEGWGSAQHSHRCVASHLRSCELLSDLRKLPLQRGLVSRLRMQPAQRAL